MPFIVWNFPDECINLQDIINQLDLIYIQHRDTETLKNYLEKAKATEPNATLCALCSLKK